MLRWIVTTTLGDHSAPPRRSDAKLKKEAEWRGWTQEQNKEGERRIAFEEVNEIIK
jgi:hypothetical protein